MDHSFNIEVAKDTGIAGAVILNNLYWWVDKNAKNGRNFNDGKYWTYNKKSASPKRSTHPYKFLLHSLWNTDAE